MFFEVRQYQHGNGMSMLYERLKSISASFEYVRYFLMPRDTHDVFFAYPPNLASVRSPLVVDF